VGAVILVGRGCWRDTAFTRASVIASQWVSEHILRSQWVVAAVVACEQAIKNTGDDENTERLQSSYDMRLCYFKRSWRYLQRKESSSLFPAESRRNHSSGFARSARQPPISPTSQCHCFVTAVCSILSPRCSAWMGGISVGKIPRLRNARKLLQESSQEHCRNPISPR
jgi:hypothetical protein